MSSKFHSLKTVSERTGLSIPTIWRYVQAGIIPAYKMGGMTWRVSEEALQQFIEHSEYTAASQSK